VASQKEALFGKLARYYDYIYYWKDYRNEAQKIIRLVLQHKHSSGNLLLDVACGTGKHISYLCRDFDCIGLDMSEDMLEVARKKVPGVEFHQGSMTDFSLAKKFDVVLCLFSSVGYLRTNSEIRKAAANFARHMKRGAVLIVEPWLRRSEWNNKTVHMQTYDGDSLKIARISFATSNGAFSVVDEWYLIGEKGKGLSYVKDHHRMRFFEPQVFLQAFRDAGLDPTFVEHGLMPGRGLIIAIKP
jgi:ubiquinone/menaquinone biosynthesis C-methylase UbiE